MRDFYDNLLLRSVSQQAVSAAGQKTAMPANLAILAITTLDYSVNLAGPAIIGFRSNAFSLPTAPLVLAGFLRAVGMASTRLRGIA